MECDLTSVSKDYEDFDKMRSKGLSEKEEQKENKQSARRVLDNLGIVRLARG